MPNHHGPPFGLVLSALCLALVFWLAPQVLSALYAAGLLPLYGQPWQQAVGLRAVVVIAVILLQLVGIVAVGATVLTAFAAFNLWWQMASKTEDPYANGFADAPFRMLLAAFVGGHFRPLALAPHPTWQVLGQVGVFLALLLAILYWMRLAEAPRRLPN